MGERGADRAEGAPSAGLVLAAVERAARHRVPQPGPAPAWLVMEHLAIPRRAGAARVARRRLEELAHRGLLTSAREHGLPAWSLTAAGRRALARGTGEQLPESPRRRSRRHARAAAGQELPRFRESLAASLAEAEAMLARAGEGRAPDAAEGPPPAQAPTAREWLAIGRALSADCRRLASAWHCLHEWEEPGDDEESGRPTDARDAARDAELAALRNVRLWLEPD